MSVEGDTFECAECGNELRIITGRFGVTETEDGGVGVYEITTHGFVRLATGDDLADALRNTADEVEP